MQKSYNNGTPTKRRLLIIMCFGNTQKKGACTPANPHLRFPSSLILKELYPMNQITVKEISKQFYDILQARGYAPVYNDEDNLNFGCVINGFQFSFDILDDECFWYGAMLNLAREQTDEEKHALARLYRSIPSEGLAFENLHIDGKEVCLSSAFPVDFYEEDMVHDAINILEHGGELIEQLKAKQQI